MKHTKVGSEQVDVNRLVKSAQDGNHTAVAELYHHFYNKIYKYVLFKTGNVTDAEDITENVFLKMMESLLSFTFQGVPFSSWLFRIAHNLIVDHYRKMARTKTAPIENAAKNVNYAPLDMDSKLDLDLSIEKVYAAMDNLTDLQREVLTLRFAGDLSIQETSIAMKKKENAVKALQHAAIVKLRSVLSHSTGPIISQSVAQRSTQS